VESQAPGLYRGKLSQRRRRGRPIVGCQLISNTDSGLNIERRVQIWARGVWERAVEDHTAIARMYKEKSDTESSGATRCER
jgi:hypothetical protein